jgi:carbonic anhydrase/acetyltransferase-like protein (isoleucine patch superfamily)
MNEQPAESKGDIIIEDDVWIGYGSIILENVKIGKGAVIGAGSVVTRKMFLPMQSPLETQRKLSKLVNFEPGASHL